MADADIAKLLSRKVSTKHRFGSEQQLSVNSSPPTRRNEPTYKCTLTPTTIKFTPEAVIHTSSKLGPPQPVNRQEEQLLELVMNGMRVAGLALALEALSSFVLGAVACIRAVFIFPAVT